MEYLLIMVITDQKKGIKLTHLGSLGNLAIYIYQTKMEQALKSGSNV